MHPAAAEYPRLDRTYLDTAGYGLPPAATVTALRAARITGSGQGAAVRLSFHLYNDTDDVAAAARVLGRHVVRRETR